MDWKEVLLVISLAGGMLVPTAIFKQWWLFSVFAIFFIIFGFVEWYATAQTGLSVSQHFWKYAHTHKVAGWLIIAGMLIGWLTLLWHLASRIDG
jgi:hypothetical protein